MAMNVGLATWRDVTGRVLLVVNSVADRKAEVTNVLEAVLADRPSESVHVVAPALWEPVLAAAGWPAERTLFALDANGSDLEMNYFLESPHTLQWIVAKEFDVVLGSAPHSMYNEEVKEVFEWRVGLVIGRGRFVAHMLPKPY